MKKKILIGSIFAVLLMLSMPVISNIQAQPAPSTTPAEKDDECDICSKGTIKDIVCDCLGNKMQHLADLANYLIDNFPRLFDIIEPIFIVKAIVLMTSYNLLKCDEE